jgi:Flp pilus assembly pilin Flp
MECNLSLRKWYRRFAFSGSGQGLVEYSVIISVLSVGLVTVLLVLRNSAGNVYNDARNGVDQAIACSNGTSSACTAGGADGSTGTGTGDSGQGSSGNGNRGGNGQGNNGNGNGNGGGNGSNGQGGGRGNSP